MRQFGYGFFAEESNLNLLSKQEVQAIGASVHGFEIGVSTVSLWGWPSNLLLIGRRLERRVSRRRRSYRRSCGFLYRRPRMRSGRAVDQAQA